VAAPADANECQISKDIRDTVAHAVEDVLSVNTSIGPSMSPQEVIAKVLQMTMTRANDKVRFRNELLPAFRGTDEEISGVIKACFPTWSRLVETSERNPLKRELHDAYVWWRYVSFCNQVREGYAVQ
jgi:hypothetical protein